MTRNTKIIAFAAALALMAMSPLVQAGGYYTWKDENGITHFAKTPPPNVNSEARNFGLKRDIHTPYVTSEIKPQVAPKASGQDDPAAPAATETAAAPAPEIYEKDPARCAHARQNLETLNTSRPIRATAADGSKSLLTPDQREQQRALAMEVIGIHC